MKISQVLLFTLIAASLLLAACGPDTQAAIATGIAQTQRVSALETAAAGGGVAQPAGNETPGPGLAFVSVSQNTNCRSGPSSAYSLLTTIAVGQQVEVLKAFSDEYVLVKNPNGPGDCWLFLQFADVTDFTALNLEVATQPPTPQVANQSSSSPTNTPTASKTSTPSQTPTEELHIRAELSLRGTIDCRANGDPSKFQAHITVNRRVTISYWWESSNGIHTAKETLEFTEEGSKDVYEEFPLYFFEGSIRLYIGNPLQIYSNRIDIDCRP